MILKRRRIVRFSLLQMCLIIPMLMLSIIGMLLTVNEMVHMEKNSLQLQMDTAEEKLQETYQTYYMESILLTNKRELTYNKMTGDFEDIPKGINVLDDKLRFDNRIHDLFLDYGMEYVYTPEGITNKNTYYVVKLGVGQMESIQRLREIVDNRQEGVSFLFRSESDGYIVYTYLPRREKGKEVLVNYVLSFAEFQDMLELPSEKQWYLLEDVYGSKVAFARDNNGKYYHLSVEEMEARIGSGRYDALSKFMGNQGIKITLYNQKLIFSRDSGIFRIQLLNMILILLGIILSAWLTWRFSRKRVNDVEYLEELAKGDGEHAFSANHMYYQLQDILISGTKKVKMYEGDLQEREKELRVKNMYILLYGGLNDSMIETAYKELGLETLPKRFFVGAFSIMEEREWELPELLTKCLCVKMKYNGQEIIVFVYDFKNTFDNMVRRRSIAQSIEQCFIKQGISKLKIGMSQIYTDPMMISSAFNEAIHVLEQLKKSEILDFCGCWEELLVGNGRSIPEVRDLRIFSTALYGKNYNDAMLALQNVVQQYGGNERGTKEHQRYIRFLLLQCVVDYLKEENHASNIVLINACLNIDVNDEKGFIHSMADIVKKCTAVNEAEYLVKMVEYIENNYQRPELTFEEVASAGGVSKSYISRIFKTQLGVTYIEYLTAVRLEKARVLLGTTEEKIGHIMEMVGYLNPSTFQRAFKSKYGISPREYRKREQERMESE